MADDPRTNLSGHSNSRWWYLLLPLVPGGCLLVGALAWWLSR